MSLLVIFFGCLALIVVEFTSPKVKVFNRHAKIGDFSLTGMEYDEGITSLNKKLNEPIYLNLESKSQITTFKELGLSINKEKLDNFTKTCRSKPFKMFCDNKFSLNLNSNEIITIDQKTLDKFLDDFEEQLQYLATNTIISFEDYSFRTLSENAEIQIDRTPFSTKENILGLFNEGRVEISITTSPEDNMTAQKTATQNLVQNMTFPLLIKYGRNPINIPSDVIAEIVEIRQKDGLSFGFINKSEVDKYLETLHYEYASEDVEVLHQQAVESISRALLFRAADYEINNAVVLPLEGQPKSNGELHDVYLEVIKSQQRLYRFENGELVKSYIVSTGLTWETPPGEYQVLGKQKMTISYYDDWYMPNYLPIGTINGYRFGFHSIPYHVDAAGHIYSRDPSTMGSPATGGCIQLTEEESLELFEWADVGTPVYIYE